MVLSKDLTEVYKKRGRVYNQTASKTEQIALCKFINDGHLARQIRKARKLYMTKSQQLCIAVNRVFGDRAIAIPGSGGFLIQIEVKSDLSAEELVKRSARVGVLLRTFETEEEEKYPKLLLSCSGVAEENFEKALKILEKEFFKDKL